MKIQAQPGFTGHCALIRFRKRMSMTVSEGSAKMSVQHFITKQHRKQKQNTATSTAPPAHSSFKANAQSLRYLGYQKIHNHQPLVPCNLEKINERMKEKSQKTLARCATPTRSPCPFYTTSFFCICVSLLAQERLQQNLPAWPPCTNSFSSASAAPIQTRTHSYW